MREQFITSINRGEVPSINWFYNYALSKGVNTNTDYLQMYLSMVDINDVIYTICVDLKINRLYSKDNKLIMLI